MPCVKPLKGYRSKFVNPKTGKRSIVFNANDGYKDLPVDVPCGQCWSCRLSHSREWAIRCVHEAQMHKQNSFITLTYNKEHYPKDHSIHKEELQRFFKRLRKHTPHRFRYFACGEYGDKNGRPHYHAILFGVDFREDRFLQTQTKRGDMLWRSPTLEKAWPYGYSYIGEMSFNSAAYVARYVMKKRKGSDEESIDPKTGKNKKEHYSITDPDAGEFYQIEPEFCLASRGSGKREDSTLWRYGLGKAWLEKYKGDTDKDFITINRFKASLPKYYDNILEVEDAIAFDERKRKRKREIIKHKEDNTPERLIAKEKVAIAKTQTLTRDYEGK